MNVPSEEEYLAWRDHPVTRFVLNVCRKTAHEVFEGWTQGAWQTGKLSEVELAEARTRADSYLALEQCDYSDWVAKSETPDAAIAVPPRRPTLKEAQAQVLLDDLSEQFRADDRRQQQFTVLVMVAGSAAIAFVAGAVIF